MSRDEENEEEDTVNDTRDLFVNKGEQVSDIEYGGLTVKIKHKEPSREIRQRAIGTAVAAFNKRFPDVDKTLPLPDVFEYTFVVNTIQDWWQMTEDGDRKEMPYDIRRGWPKLREEHHDFAEEILNVIGAEKVVESMRGRVKENQGPDGQDVKLPPEEVEKAKN